MNFSFGSDSVTAARSRGRSAASGHPPISDTAAEAGRMGSAALQFAASAPPPRNETTSKRGIVRTKLGRPGAEPDKIERARRELAKGIGIGKVAREVGLGVGTVHRLKREIEEHAAH